MATQEITLKFNGDPTLLKNALAQVRSDYASTMADVTKQTRLEAQAAAALQRQRSSALLTIWKADTRAAIAEQRARTQAILQEEKQLAAQMIREARATQTSRSQATQAVEREERQLAATMIREARAAETSKSQATRASQRERTQAERQLAIDIRRFETERKQIAIQNSQAIITQAKTEADARIREGRRAANAVIASLREELRAAQANQRQLAARTRGSSAFLAGAVGGVTALVGVSAASEIRAGAVAWLDYASKLETTRIAFTQMLGSAELAQRHLNELQAFALKTPFQFAELIDASQRMQALGFNAQQVIPILTDVGNAVAAAGGGSERLDRVVLAISQIQSKGKVATQEMNQLAEAGIPAWRILEEQLGRSRAELIKMVEQGQISSAVFLEAFQKFSQQNFGGLMEQQSKTFTGAMSNIKDALLQTSATAFQPLYDRLNELAKRMSDTSTKSQEFRDFMNSVGRQLARVWDGAVEAIHILHDAYRLVVASITGQVGAVVHSFLAFRHAVNAATFSLEALAAIARGDLIAAHVAMQKNQQQATLAVLEMKNAVVAAGSAWRELGNIMDRAGERALAAAEKARAAAQMVGVDPTGPEGIFRRKVKPIPTFAPTKTEAPTGKTEAERLEEQRLDFFTKLQEEVRKLRAELQGVDTATRTFAVSQSIVNGLLKDASPEFQKMTQTAAKQVDNLTTQLRLQKELRSFLEDQEEAVRLIIEGEQSHLRVTQEFIQSLRRQGAVLQDTTVFWLQFNATIRDASEASKRLIDDLEALREASRVTSDIPLPSPKIEDIFPEGIPEPPAPPIELTQWEIVLQHIKASMVDFSNFVTGTLIGAFDALTDAVRHSVAAWALYGESITAALKKALAGVLAQIAGEAAIQALLHGAYAIAKLAMLDFRGAALHGLAAAKFAAVAAAAGFGAKAIAGNAFNAAAGGGGAGPTTQQTPERDRTIRERRAGGAPSPHEPTTERTIIIEKQVLIKPPEGWVMQEVRSGYPRGVGGVRDLLRSDLLGEANG